MLLCTVHIHVLMPNLHDTYLLMDIAPAKQVHVAVQEVFCHSAILLLWLVTLVYILLLIGSFYTAFYNCA